jgi:molybdenum cofactor cytidylyltransferase
VERVLVVLGHRSEEIQAVLAAEGVETLFNPRYPQGMLTSVQAGAAAAGNSEWIAVALGEQPSLRPETLGLQQVARLGPEVGVTMVVPS